MPPSLAEFRGKAVKFEHEDRNRVDAGRHDNHSSEGICLGFWSEESIGGFKFLAQKVELLI